jgi:hypothetical protein
MKDYPQAVLQHLDEINDISKYSDDRVYKIGQLSALEELYKTAIFCSVGHHVSDQDSMYIIDNLAFTEAYSNLIKEL